VSRWPHGDPNAVVKDVLSQSAYHTKPTASDSPVLRFWEELWQWIGNITRPFFHWLDGALSSGHGTAQVITVAIVAVTLAALGFLIYRIALAFVNPVAERRRGMDRPLDERLDAAAWQALAAERAARGDYASAIAALFAAALALLDERALVPFNASRTPGEYRRLVRSESPALAAPFDVLSDRFVRAAFAEEPARREDCDIAFAAFDELQPREGRA
jgi:hypothetical protein